MDVRLTAVEVALHDEMHLFFHLTIFFCYWAFNDFSFCFPRWSLFCPVSVGVSGGFDGRCIMMYYSLYYLLHEGRRGRISLFGLETNDLKHVHQRHCHQYELHFSQPLREV